MHILVTGGTGFIGSHTVVELLENNYEVTIIDDLENSKEEVVERIARITGKKPAFANCDMKDFAALETVFKANAFDAVIHFAGYKAVAESVAKPLMYYENNLLSTINLLKLMEKYNVKRLIFSSSATVYGLTDKCPIKEDTALGCLNPYGRTKLFIEEILRDYCFANKDFCAVMLRYFNPVGAHPSSLIREDPNGIPNNLMPRIIQAARGQIGGLSVFGNDYPTRDGTCIRDYIHVVDLAKGHVAAINYTKEHTGSVEINLGTGTGVTVLEIINAFERVNGIKVPYRITDRRPGDSTETFADTEKAFRLLGWRAELNIEDMCRDAWKGATSVD